MIPIEAFKKVMPIQPLNKVMLYVSMKPIDIYETIGTDDANGDIQ